MTKVRAPLSLDGALARIAGQLPGSWAEMAKEVDRSERQVRNWGDPDVPDAIPMPAAIKLDLAFQKAGGEGAPIHDVYALLLHTARSDAFADQIDLSRHTAVAIRENAEAACAQIRCTMPGASPNDLAAAVRETEEAINAATATLAVLRRGMMASQGP
jgi:hypothetical protein